MALEGGRKEGGKGGERERETIWSWKGTAVTGEENEWGIVGEQRQGRFDQTYMQKNFKKFF